MLCAKGTQRLFLRFTSIVRLASGVAKKTTGEAAVSVLVVQPDRVSSSRDIARRSAKAQLAEACSLLEAFPGHVVAGTAVLRQRNDAGLGDGQLKELAATIQKKGIGAVFLNDTRLSARKHAHYETVFGCPVLDRFGVILRIFSHRASTKASKLQVELAEIAYQKTRLVDASAGFDQQRGGSATIGGGGEKLLELTRRTLKDREAFCKRELAKAQKNTEIQRGARKRNNIPVVSLVGYTNAGKSLLHERLCAVPPSPGDSKAKDMLFASLDTTARLGRLPSGLQAVFVDTVGFVSDLPHDLVESFRSTLAEAVSADVVVHVRDVCHPEFHEQGADVLEVLSALDVGSEVLADRLEVWNKVDACREAAVSRVEDDADAGALLVSAKTGEGCDRLLQLIEKKVFKATGRRCVEVHLKYGTEAADDMLSELASSASTTVDTQVSEDGELATLRVVMDKAAIGRWNKRFPTNQL